MANWDEYVAVENRTFSFFWEGMRNLWHLMGQERKRAFRVIIYMLIGQVFHLLGPYFMKFTIDEIESSEYFSPSLIFWITLMLTVFISDHFVHRMVREKAFLRLGIVLENLWPQISHSKLLNLSMTYHVKENIGRKVSKIKDGCNRLINVLCNLYWGLFPRIAYLLVNLFFVVIIDVRLALVLFTPFWLAFWLNNHAYRKYIPMWEDWQDKKECSDETFVDSVSGVLTVQCSVQEQKEIKNFNLGRLDMKELDTEACMGVQKYHFGADSILSVSFTFTLLMSAALMFLNEISIGSMVFILFTAKTTIQNVIEINFIYKDIIKHLIAVRRMRELLEVQEDIRNVDNPLVLQKFRADISLKQVVFTYPNKSFPVIRDLNLDIREGMKLAVVGLTGGGKSTIINLINRIYDPDSGVIYLDGVDIKKFEYHWYRSLFAVVPQQVDIFSKSIYENVRYSVPSASRDRVENALRAASLDSVLDDREKFPQGIFTQVGERGVRLSGGERQRVALARAILAWENGARILMLDEATSEMDVITEKAVQNVIDRINGTMIIIAHRLSTVYKADMICVVDNGRIVEQGTHAQLEAKNGIYSKLVEYARMGELR